MNDVGKQIADLIKARGKSAPEMTHALKFIGDGNMQDGIKRIADYLMKEGQKNGAMKGAIGGVAVTSIIFGMGIFIREKIKENKKLKAEGEAILKGLGEGLSDNEASEDFTCDFMVEEKTQSVDI